MATPAAGQGSNPITMKNWKLTLRDVKPDLLKSIESSDIPPQWKGVLMAEVAAVTGKVLALDAHGIEHGGHRTFDVTISVIC